MTSKRTQMSSLATLLSAVFLLLSLTETATSEKEEIYPAKVIARIPDDDQSVLEHTVGDLFDDGQFAVLAHRIKDPTIKSIRLYGFNKIGFNECTLPQENKVVWPVRRLSYNTVLVQLHNGHLDHENRKLVKLLLVNTQNCSQKFAYDREILVETIFMSDDPNDESFTLVTSSREHCNGQNWCRLTFHPLFRKLEPLDFDFVWDSSVIIEPVGSFDSNRFAVHSTDKITGTRSIRMYDLSANKTGTLYKELLNFPKFKLTGSNLKNADKESSMLARLFNFDFYYVSSSKGLSYCYQTYLHEKSHNFINCSRFDEDGSSWFSISKYYEDIHKIKDVITIPNGLVIIAWKPDCNPETDECSILQVGAITRDNKSNEVQIRHRQIDYKCGIGGQVISIVVRANEDDGSVDGQYLCSNANYWVYGSFSID